MEILLTCSECPEGNYAATRTGYTCTVCGHTITAQDVTPHLDAGEYIVVIGGRLAITTTEG